MEPELNYRDAARDFAKWCDSVREQCRDSDLTHDEIEDVICIMCNHESFSVSDAIRELRYMQYCDCGAPQISFTDEGWFE